MRIFHMYIDRKLLWFFSFFVIGVFAKPTSLLNNIFTDLHVFFFVSGAKFLLWDFEIKQEYIFF